MRKVINPRKYREIVAVYRWVESQPNKLNEPQRVEQEICRRQAEVKPLSGRELWQANQVDEQVNYRVTIPFDSLIAATTSKEWMVWITGGGRRLEVRSVIDVDNEHQEMMFDCSVTT